jgi:5'-3' exoribonuclease 1
MNGIIHNCTHANEADGIATFDEEKMMLKIISYIDILVRIVKPQQMLFMAIDGRFSERSPLRP